MTGDKNEQGSSQEREGGARLATRARQLSLFPARTLLIAPPFSLLPLANKKKGSTLL